MQRHQLHSLLDGLCRAGHLVAPFQTSLLAGGRTNRVWKISAGNRVLVLKVYAGSDLNPVFPNNPEAERISLLHLEGSGFAPRLIETGTHLSASWALFEYVDGPTWATDTARVGHALKSLHSVPSPQGLRHAPNGSEAIARQTGSILDLCTGAEVLELQRAVPQTPHVPPGPTALIHGDPVAANIIVAQTGLCFIDWQCPAIGDPCDDLAVFLSPAMQQIYRGTPLAPDEEDECLDGYGSDIIATRYRRLKPWYHWRMSAYCLWRLQSGDREYAAGLDLERQALSRACAR